MAAVILYDENQLKLAQKAGLELLLELDRLSKDYGFRYFLDAGTLIGAVRHQGFIPWDDDVDVAMTRSDFERFLAVKDMLSSRFELVMPNGYNKGRAFYDFTPRIIYKNSKRHSSTEESEYYGGKLNHLWVDIFILDNIPDNAALDKLTRFLQKCIYGMAMQRRYGIDFSKYSFSDKLKVAVLSLIGKVVPLSLLFSMQDRLSRLYDKKKTKRLYYSNYQPDFMQVTLRREWIEEPQSLSFEGHELSVPGDYDSVLREIYGDYTKLPPVEKRIPSHGSEKIEVF